jgi:hypothetical protein
LSELIVNAWRGTPAAEAGTGTAAMTMQLSARENLKAGAPGLTLR